MIAQKLVVGRPDSHILHHPLPIVDDKRDTDTSGLQASTDSSGISSDFSFLTTSLEAEMVDTEANGD